MTRPDPDFQIPIFVSFVINWTVFFCWPAGIRLGQAECQNISDFFTFVKAEANTRNADSLQMWVVHQRVCVCVCFF